MNYGDVALGVECALPASVRALRRESRVQRLVTWLIAALKNRA